jgi:hypothetical protein
MNKNEVGDKRPLSYALSRCIKQAESDLIQSKTAEFIANNGQVQQIEPGVMNTPTKGHTAIRINNNG